MNNPCEECIALAFSSRVLDNGFAYLLSRESPWSLKTNRPRKTNLHRSQSPALGTGIAVRRRGFLPLPGPSWPGPFWAHPASPLPWLAPATGKGGVGASAILVSSAWLWLRLQICKFACFPLSLFPAPWAGFKSLIGGGPAGSQQRTSFCRGVKQKKTNIKGP